ncbi:hypothetical protein VTH06DRAFT_1320 [Thermothelomyces fergusii]
MTASPTRRDDREIRSTAVITSLRIRAVPVAPSSQSQISAPTAPGLSDRAEPSSGEEKKREEENHGSAF